MSESQGKLPCPAPVQVTYHPVTGVPEEFHDYLHKDTEEFKLWKGLTEAAAAPAAEMEGLSVADADAAPAAVAEAPKPKKKGKAKEKEVVITSAKRQRKKCITTVEGLELFSVKLADAAKVFGKKYACGSSVVKNPSLKEQIDIQGDVQEVIPELILKQYGASCGIEAKHIILVVDKQRVPYEEF